MRFKALLPIMIVFTMVSALSQTIETVVHAYGNKQFAKELKKESEEEKSEEKTEEKEREMNELISFKLNTLFQALSSELQAAEKRSYTAFQNNYQEPFTAVITPPPKV